MIKLFKCRHIMAFMGFTAFIILYMLRVNLSVAIVSMVNKTHVDSFNNDSSHSYSECINNIDNNTDTNPDIDERLVKLARFTWTPTQQGLILGSFFWGYVCTQIPSAILIQLISPKWIFCFAIVVTSLLTLLTPIAAELGFAWLIALRVIEGLSEGLSLPAMTCLLGRWCPPLERSKLAAFVYSGTQMGTIIGLPLSGWICSSTFLGGWPTVFYCFGALGVFWSVGWILLAADSPALHPFISPSERDFIIKSIQIVPQTKQSPLPLRAVFTSLPFLALCISHTVYNWSWNILITSLPAYMADVLGFNIAKNGLMSALPYCCGFVIIMSVSQLVDALRTKRIVSTTVVRKSCNFIGFLGLSIGLICVGLIKCDVPLAITLLCITMCIMACCQCGFAVNHLDIAPQFSGSLYSITNTMAAIPGIVGPYVLGVLNEAHPGRIGWLYFFYISAGLSMFGAFSFAIFGSGERQPWAIDKSEQEFLVNNTDDDDGGDGERGEHNVINIQ